MSTDKERLDLIEHYLQDKLSEDEATEKERLLSEDNGFREAFHEYRLLVEGVKYSGRKELLKKFREIEERNFGNENSVSPGRSLRKYYIGMAASIGLLLLSYLGVQEFYINTPEKIAASYFEPYPALVGGATRSAEEEEKTDFENAMLLFESGKYEEAIEIYAELETPENEELVKFYMANAYQAKNYYSEAIEIYREIIADNGIFKDQARWYLALAYLASENITQASDLLASIKNSGNDYAEKAEKVLNSIN